MEYFKFLYSSSPSLKINLSPNIHKSYKHITKDNEVKEYPVFYDTDEISGNIELKLNNKKSLIYESVLVNITGILFINSDNTKIKTEIYKESQEISEKNSPNIIINEITNFFFKFTPKIKPYESYLGNRLLSCINSFK